MSDLTREEVRAACEAVGWEWNERRVPKGEEDQLLDYDHAVVPKYGGAFHPALPSRLSADTIALLEATGEEYEIQRHRIGRSPGFAVTFVWCLTGELPEEPDLSTAAVRAVNAWAEAKKEETP